MKLASVLKEEIMQSTRMLVDCPFENPEFYKEWLSQTFYFAKETTSLLTMAAGYSEANSKLQFRFNQHAFEEKGHEKLLLMDLKSLNTSIEKHPEQAPTSSLYQSQFYWIQRGIPKAFFGYIVFLEGLGSAAGRDLYNRTSETHGKNASHFLKVHGEDDIEHVEKAFREIEEFDPATQKICLQNFNHAAACYRWMLENAKMKVGKKDRSDNRSLVA